MLPSMFFGNVFNRSTLLIAVSIKICLPLLYWWRPKVQTCNGPAHVQLRQLYWWPYQSKEALCPKTGMATVANRNKAKFATW